MSKQTGISRESRLRILDSVGGPGAPTITQLSSWLRSLPQDLAPGEIASVLERAENHRFGMKRVYRRPNAGPRSDPGSPSNLDNLPELVLSTELDSAGRKGPRREHTPRNPSLGDYGKELLVPPESLFASVEERTAETDKPTVRQAVILEKFGITEPSVEKMTEVLKDMVKRTYPHEQAPLLAELIHRYPEMVTYFEFSVNDENSISVFDRALNTSVDKSRGHVKNLVPRRNVVVRVPYGPFTGPMVYEAINLAPTAIAMGVAEDKNPRGSVFNSSRYKVSETVRFTLDDEDELEDLWEITDPEEVRATDYGLVLDDFADKSRAIQDGGRFNPHREHKVVGDLVFQHDVDHVEKLLSKSDHSKRRHLEMLANKPPHERASYTISTIGDYDYLLYKGVEIISAKRQSSQADTARRKTGQRRENLGYNKSKKKAWIDRHRSYCRTGCRLCTSAG